MSELHAAWPSSDSADHSPSAELQALRERFDKWLAGVREKVADWKPLRPVRATSNLPLLTIESDDSIFVSGDTTKRDEYVVTFVSPPTPLTALRLEALPDARLPDYGPGMTYYEGRKGDFFLGELRLVADGQPVAIREASHSYAKNQYGGEVSAALTIDGDLQTGWSTYEQNGQRHIAIYVLETPLEEVGELRLTMQFGRHFASSLGRFRISVTGDQKSLKATRLPDAVEPLISKPADGIDSSRAGPVVGDVPARSARVRCRAGRDRAAPPAARVRPGARLSRAAWQQSATDTCAPSRRVPANA